MAAMTNHPPAISRRARYTLILGVALLALAGCGDGGWAPYAGDDDGGIGGLFNGGYGGMGMGMPYFGGGIPYFGGDDGGFGDDD